MWRLSNIIFGLFGEHYKREDLRKDELGRGLAERINIAVAEEFDDNLNNKITSLVANCLNPILAEAKFIPELEDMTGTPPVIGDLEMRRKVVSYMRRLCNIKGTKRSYEVLFRLLGFTGVELYEDWSKISFDSPLTLDDPERRFDMGLCPSCSDYNINLLGQVTVTPTVLTYIYNIIRFSQPINANLTGITYNEGHLVEKVISVKMENGRLYYDNEYDPELELKIEQGRLMIRGPQAASYYIENGHLLYRI
jgi:hypothetical protein